LGKHLVEILTQTDITHKAADQLRERFPGIYAVCIERGINLTGEPIPGSPPCTIAAAALLPTIAAERL
jgi:L-aspartate oxidase